MPATVLDEIRNWFLKGLGKIPTQPDHANSVFLWADKGKGLPLGEPVPEFYTGR
jgi:hypothetical protein